ncbi:hypothetical protein TSOC_009226 [Tetrabaena socialis]|uniref:Uncharacterized protein n=1 Tax=Tetrabaena socialis TaxID=47790 RepID=A0A2J7ZWD9_9CHLO|nr:hypothetical protein TSOC_009226 [Tetrabaena socialis]|eukprot:PNH04587.1 hypothetical protein TSOC_009226 [Tetrabaena socialis]
MDAGQGGPKTAQSPFSLFKPASWNKISKKGSQASMGEDNSMYYHPELKRWVERGKEEEAEREAAGPAPPPLVSGGSSFTTGPGHKFLTLCANWQLANPGLPYSPQLLLQQLAELEAGQQQAEAGGAQAALEGAVRAGGDVALAAEGNGGGSGGGADGAEAPPPALAAVEWPHPGAAPLSSYERACRQAELGQPAAGLLARLPPAASAAAPAADAPPQQHAAPVSKRAPVSVAESIPTKQMRLGEAAPAPAPRPEAPAPLAFTAAAPAPHEPEPFQSLEAQGGASIPDSPAAASPAAAGATPVGHLDLSSLAAGDSPSALLMPGSARSDDPFAGTEHLPFTPHAHLLNQPPSPAGSPVRGVSQGGGRSLEEVMEEDGASSEGEGAAGAEAASPPPPAALASLNAEEAVNFFDHLGGEEAAGEETVVVAVAEEEVAAVPAAAPAEQEPEQAAEEDAPAPEAAAAAAAAAAAIDGVVRALEQLRSGAAAGEDGPGDGTALLLQIQASLAHATRALADMGIDVGALSSLAGAAQLAAPTVAAADWTPAPGSKRPRKDASPATPTRAGVPAGDDGVVTPLLLPGVPLGRAAEEDAAACFLAGPGDRFQRLGSQLSHASDEGAAAAAATPPFSVELPRDAQPPEPAVVVSLTVVAAPEVDVAALEARVRGSERAGWEARLGVVVDSEREAASLVTACVEAERDGLRLHVGGLEQQLAAAQAQRAALEAQVEAGGAARAELAQRLEAVEAEAPEALAAARAEAAAERAALSAALAEAVAGREAVVAELAVERSEKAELAGALAAARADSASLRQRYAARFESLSSELEASRCALSELQCEHDELLLCLGQESTKVGALTEAVRAAGGDPEPLLAEIEAEYECMGAGPEAEEGAGEEEAEV